MIAIVHVDNGRAEQALAFTETALALISEVGDRLFEAYVLNVQGAARLALGQHTQALANFEAAWQSATDCGEPACIIQAQIGLAEAQAHFGRSSVAVEHGQWALEQAQKLSYRLLEAEALVALARVTGNRGYAAQAPAIHRETGYVAGLRRALAVVAELDTRNSS